MTIHETNNVINGPWKAMSKRKVILPLSDEVIEVQENTVFCDNLTEGLMVQMIYSMDENGFEIQSEEFLRDIGFIIESVRSCLYREMKLEHPLSELIKSLTMEIGDDEEEMNTPKFGLDEEKIHEVKVKFGNDDNEKEETETDE